MAPAGPADLDLLVSAAREAGVLALTFFGRDPQSWAKGATSIVSEADLAVDKLLTERLRGARPDYGWLSEETADTAERLGRRHAFVVDPIDGTRAFLSGGRQWAVSLAVVAEGRPVTAVLFAPALDELYSATVGGGARLGERTLAVSGRQSLAGASFAGPKRFVRDAAEAAGVPVKDIRYVPSLAYRLTLVAAGAVDVAISGPNANDWDLAAADLLVHEAGGIFTDLAGRQPRYNRPAVTHPVLIAATPRVGAEVAGLIGAFEARVA
jgi:myo-inositol-1(or 4)-monophosphatase